MVIQPGWTLFKVGSIFLSIFLTPSVVWAYGYYGGSGDGDFETSHILSYGGGIASPSVTSSLYENPAGLAYNMQTKILGALGAGNDNFNPVGSSGSVYLGNGIVGGGLGIQTFNGQSGSSITLFNYGIGSYIESMNLSVGVTGTYTLQNSGATTGTGTGSTSNANLGVLFNPKGSTRLGVSLFQVVAGVQAIGVGLASDANEYATFVLDATSSPQGQGKIIKPAMGIHLSDFQCTLGYAFDLDTLSPSWIRQGASFGIGVRVNPMFHIQFYYNELARYYAGVTIRLW